MTTDVGHSYDEVRDETLVWNWWCQSTWPCSHRFFTAKGRFQAAHEAQLASTPKQCAVAIIDWFFARHEAFRSWITNDATLSDLLPVVHLRGMVAMYADADDVPEHFRDLGELERSAVGKHIRKDPLNVSVGFISQHILEWQIVPHAPLETLWTLFRRNPTRWTVQYHLLYQLCCQAQRLDRGQQRQELGQLVRSLLEQHQLDPLSPLLGSYRYIVTEPSSLVCVARRCELTDLVDWIETEIRPISPFGIVARHFETRCDNGWCLASIGSSQCPEWVELRQTLTVSRIWERRIRNQSDLLPLHRSK